MPVTRWAKAAVGLSLIFGSLCAMPALADNSYPTRILPTPSAPVLLTSCRTGDVATVAVNAMNRADIFLSSITVRFTMYDHGGTMISQRDIVWDMQSDLAPGDSILRVDQVSGTPMNALAYGTCRLQSARFEGGKSWTYGRTWNGHLSPVSAGGEQTSDNGANRAAAPGAALRPGAVAITVMKSWNDQDPNSGLTIVHDTISIQPKSDGVTILPSQFGLTMNLANGAQKTYSGMTQPAPSYQKVNLMTGQPLTAYEVDPAEDLGRIGSITVPAHGNALVTVSFIVNDVVANASDNKNVALQ